MSWQRRARAQPLPLAPSKCPPPPKVPQPALSPRLQRASEASGSVSSLPVGEEAWRQEPRGVTLTLKLPRPTVAASPNRSVPLTTDPPSSDGTGRCP